MRSLPFIIGLGLASTILGQTDARSPWALGVSVSVDHCFRSLRNDAGDETRAMIIAFREEHESPRWSWTSGMEVTYTLGSHWLISSGLQVSDRGYLFEQETALISADPNDPALPASSVRLEFREHFRYLSLPLMIHRVIGTGGFRFEPGLGVWADLFMDQYSQQRRDFAGIVQTARVSDNTTDFREFGATLCVELPVRLKLGTRWSIRIGPRGRLQATALADTPIKGHLWEAGLLAGAQFHL